MFVKKLYRFRPHYDHNKDRLKHLENTLQQKLYIPKVETLNDPYEGKFKSIPLSSDTILSDPNMLSQMLSETRKRGEPDITKDEFIKRLNSQDFRKALSKSCRTVNIFQNHGVICFSSENNNIPMWTYYANYHQGYCLEFELDFGLICKEAKIPLDMHKQYIDEVISGEIPILFNACGIEFAFLKVRYQKTLPVLDENNLYKLGDTAEGGKYMLYNSLGVKYEQWAHENEFRLVLNQTSQPVSDKPEPTLLFLPNYAPFLKVTSIILGEKMLNDDKDELVRLAKKYQIGYQFASCSEDDYNISLKG